MLWPWISVKILLIARVKLFLTSAGASWDSIEILATKQPWHRKSEGFHGVSSCAQDGEIYCVPWTFSDSQKNRQHDALVQFASPSLWIRRELPRCLHEECHWDIVFWSSDRLGCRQAPWLRSKPPDSDRKQTIMPVSNASRKHRQDWQYVKNRMVLQNFTSIEINDFTFQLVFVWFDTMDHSWGQRHCVNQFAAWPMNALGSPLKWARKSHEKLWSSRVGVLKHTIYYKLISYIIRILL